MKIRNASAADLDDLWVLNQQITEYHHTQAPAVFAAPGEEAKEFMHQALLDDNRTFLVCEQHARVIAFLSAVIDRNQSNPFIVSDPICRIGTIVVDQQHRSAGIGRLLINACEQWAQSQGAIDIRLEVMEFNQRALSFYHALGFDTLSRIMVKSL